MSLRIGTFNTQLRSTITEVFADLDVDPTNNAPKRAENLAKNILASEFDYDIIALNEVFDEEAREILSSRLKTKYPNQVTKCDVDQVALMLQVGVFAFNPIAQLYALALFTVNNFDLDESGLLLKVEDSGLMLFSKWSFATNQHGNPDVVFYPFTSSAFDDSLAAKGVCYVQILDPDGRKFHVFFTHMNAAPESSPLENRSERADQLKTISELMDTVLTVNQRANENVFVMGDFNIEGNQRADQGDLEEWKEHFSNGASRYTSIFHDAWVRDQCPGQPNTPDDIGLTSLRRRFDYFIHGNHVSDRLVLQHMTLAYNLLDNTRPYTSDHFGLNMDLHFKLPHCNPLDAFPVIDKPDFIKQFSFRPAQMVWFKYDEPGTYSFRVSSETMARLDFEVYARNDMSVPMAWYKEEKTQFAELDFRKYVLTEAPFYVRVFSRDRAEDGPFEFRSHKHEGRSRADAIHLPPYFKREYEFPQTAPAAFTQDDPGTPWSEEDAVWFSLDTEGTETNAYQQITFRLDADKDFILSMDLVSARNEPLHWVRGAAALPSPVELEHAERHKVRYYLLVKRNDPAYDKIKFRILWMTNLSILHGHEVGLGGQPLMIKCEDETNPEIGSDDIALKVHVDGVLWKTITNSEIGDFDGDDLKSLHPFIKAIRYVNTVKFEIAEEDWIADDIGQIQVPALGAGQVQQLNEIYKTNFDSGEYWIRCNRSRWSPSKL